MPLNRIKQTSKLLLLEEFCNTDGALDLCTLLKNEEVKQKTEFFKLIEDKLEVKNYEEFVEKLTDNDLISIITLLNACIED